MSRRLLAALAAGAWNCLAEPAKIFPAVFAYNDDEIAEQAAGGVFRFFAEDSCFCFSSRYRSSS